MLNSHTPIVTVESDRKLLILDLDETLVHSTAEPLGRDADFRIGKYFVYRRPHLDELLTACGGWFDLAVWSSSTVAYTRAIVETIFSDPTALSFVWGRERCTLATDVNGELCWHKPLRKVTRRGFRAESTIAVDDSPEKWVRSYGNVVHVKPFVGDQSDTELKILLSYLDRLRGAEDIRAIEKRFWRSCVL
jgi:TFIIF-interacting CTD phosphatase-like protein